MRKTSLVFAKKNYYYFSDYPWCLIKEFLFRKTHPTAKLLKTLCDRYRRPQIFMSIYYKLSNGMFVKLPKPCLQIDPPLDNNNDQTTVKFCQYVRFKSIKRIKY